MKTFFMSSNLGSWLLYILLIISKAKQYIQFIQRYMEKCEQTLWVEKTLCNTEMIWWKIWQFKGNRNESKVRKFIFHQANPLVTFFFSSQLTFLLFLHRFIGRSLSEESFKKLSHNDTKPNKKKLLVTYDYMFQKKMPDIISDLMFDGVFV